MHLFLLNLIIATNIEILFLILDTELSSRFGRDKENSHVYTAAKNKKFLKTVLEFNISKNIDSKSGNGL